MTESSDHRSNGPATADGTGPIRVLLWSPNGAGLHYGGPGMVAYRMYASAPELGIVELAHGSGQQEQYDRFSATHHISSVSSRALDQAQFILRGRRWIRSNGERFDVFHGLQAFDLTVRPALAAMDLGIPAVVKVAGHRAEVAGARGWRRATGVAAQRRRVMRQLSAIIALSEEIEQELLLAGVPEKSVIRIPNGVDTAYFTPSKDKNGYRDALGWPNRPTVTIAGGITARKRFEIAIKALRAAVRSGADCQLAVVGPIHDDEYSKSLHALAQRLDVYDRVIWSGFTTDMPSVYRATDVFVLPSAREGMPNALLEAMASGLPSVITGFSGATDLIIPGESGEIADPHETPIASAILQYLTDPALAHAHGVRARQHVEAKFSVTIVRRMYKELFSSLIAGRPIR